MAAPKLSVVENPKVPPHSLEAEQSVLGGLMLSSMAWDQIADKVVEADFYREDHRLIFQAITDLHENSRPCDAVTVTEWFESHGKADVIDGGNYISQLANNTPSAAIVNGLISQLTTSVIHKPFGFFPTSLSDAKSTFTIIG